MIEIVVSCVVMAAIVYGLATMIMDDYATKQLDRKKKSIDEFLKPHRLALYTMPMRGRDDAPCQIRFSVYANSKAGISSRTMLRMLKAAKRSKYKSVEIDRISELRKKCIDAERIFNDRNHKEKTL